MITTILLALSLYIQQNTLNNMNAAKTTKNLELLICGVLLLTNKAYSKDVQDIRTLFCFTGVSGCISLSFLVAKRGDSNGFGSSSL